VPSAIEFHTKGELAREQIEAALATGIPRGVVLADAAYGDEADFRQWLSARDLDYVLAVRSATSVWWGRHQPAKVSPSARGRPRTRLKRDARHQPIGVLALARSLPARRFRTVTWREGANGALSSRFAALRVRAAQGNRARPEEWLLIEWPLSEAQPSHYWLSTLPENLSLKQLVANAKGRWRIERDYQELKSELGLGHYEGRNWRGFHHHATLCIAAYGFLMLERLAGKKNAARFTAPPLPKSFRPRGSSPQAASRALVDRHRALPSRARPRSNIAAVSMLRDATG
jgi:SRSO17 transposase